MNRQSSTTRLVFILAVLLTPIVLSAPHPVHATPLAAYSDHVLTIIMENNQRDQIMPQQPYQTEYANSHSQLTNYVQTSDNGSLPNYVSLVSGQNPSWSSCNAPPSNCQGLPNGGSTNMTIMDRLDSSGLSWKSYMEDMSQNCYDPHAEYSTGPGGGTYYPRHNPFIYYRNVMNNPSECAKNIPAGNYCISAASTVLQVSSCVSNLLTDLNSPSPPNFMWLTPNGCNQTHDCNGLTDSQTRAVGDKYLSILIPLILSTPTFTSPGSNAALFVTYDECGTCTTRPLYAVWAGPGVSTPYTSSISYNHYSLLKTLENNWNLPSLGSGDVSASSMKDVFNPILPGSFNEKAWSHHAVFPSTAIISPGTNGILYTRVSNIATSYTGSYYAVGLLGTADWSSPGPVIPGSYLSMDGSFTSLGIASGRNTNFKIGTDLYFYFQSPQSGTSCDRSRTNISWLDIQIQFTNYDSQTGGYKPSGSYIGCAGPNSISYRETVATTLPGQDFRLSNFDITALYQRALAAQHLPSTTSGNLAGVEAGVAGYNVNDLSATYRHLRIGPAILSNNPSSADWVAVCGCGTWSQVSGYVDGQNAWAELKSSATFASDRTVTLRMLSITTGSHQYNAAWVRPKYIDNNNEVMLLMHTDGALELSIVYQGTERTLAQVSTGLNATAWHTFKTTITGNTVNVWVDGTQYMTNIADLNGQIGALGPTSVALMNGGNTHSQFDAVTIS